MLSLVGHLEFLIHRHLMAVLPSVATLNDILDFLEIKKLYQNSINLEVESFLLNAIKMNFFEQLNLSWKIIFPPHTSRKNSNVRVAKQHLKMILFSDRHIASDEDKQKIVSSIVALLSDFVDIESHDKVQLSVSPDADVGTIYSVTMPVRRVRSEYQLDDKHVQ